MQPAASGGRKRTHGEDEQGSSDPAEKKRRTLEDLLRVLPLVYDEYSIDATNRQSGMVAELEAARATLNAREAVLRAVEAEVVTYRDNLAQRLKDIADLQEAVQLEQTLRLVSEGLLSAREQDVTDLKDELEKDEAKIADLKDELEKDEAKIKVQNELVAILKGKVQRMEAAEEEREDARNYQAEVKRLTLETQHLRNWAGGLEEENRRLQGATKAAMAALSGKR